MTADPAHIVICAGFAHGLAGISRALRTAGAATLAVEAYGHQTHRDIAAGQGLRLRPLPVDGMGAVVGQAAGADAVLLTPAHQFPLGVTLHPRRRREVAEFIASGGYDRQIRRARLVYRRRRDRLAAALRRQGLRVTGIAAGMHAVLELPRASLEHAALSGASEHGVAIDGLEHFRAGGTGPNDDGHRVRAGLVIGYGRPPEHAYTTALARLCAVLADLR